MHYATVLVPCAHARKRRSDSESITYKQDLSDEISMYFFKRFDTRTFQCHDRRVAALGRSHMLAKDVLIKDKRALSLLSSEERKDPSQIGTRRRHQEGRKCMLVKEKKLV